MEASLNGHPCAAEHTALLLRMAKLSPCRILDMGAGRGETIALLRALGFEATGIDLVPSDGIVAGDYLRCPFPDASFDAVISECSFYSSGDEDAALREAARILRPGGSLLLADLLFGDVAEGLGRMETAGLHVLDCYDATADWKRFYAACLWAGTARGIGQCPGNKRCRYLLVVCVKQDAR